MTKRAVRVHQIPRNLTPELEKRFLEDLRGHAQTERPRFVVDCSEVVTMDVTTVRLLLCCLEEAMKCNGDVRLASLRPQAMAELAHAGVSRLFESFATPEMAVQSFARATSMAGVSTQKRAARHDNEQAA